MSLHVGPDHQYGFVAMRDPILHGLGLVLKWLSYRFLDSDYSRGPVVNFPHFGSTLNWVHGSQTHIGISIEQGIWPGLCCSCSPCGTGATGPLDPFALVDPCVPEV